MFPNHILSFNLSYHSGIPRMEGLVTAEKYDRPIRVTQRFLLTEKETATSFLKKCISEPKTGKNIHSFTFLSEDSSCLVSALVTLANSMRLYFL